MYIQHIYENNSLSKCMVCDGNWLRLAIFSWMSLNSCEVSILIHRAKDQSMRKESATGRANCIHIKKWLKTQRTLYRFVGITIASKISWSEKEGRRRRRSRKNQQSSERPRPLEQSNQTERAILYRVGVVTYTLQMDRI